MKSCLVHIHKNVLNFREWSNHFCWNSGTLGRCAEIPLSTISYFTRVVHRNQKARFLCSLTNEKFTEHVHFQYTSASKKFTFVIYFVKWEKRRFRVYVLQINWRPFSDNFKLFYFILILHTWYESVLATIHLNNIPVFSNQYNYILLKDLHYIFLSVIFMLLLKFYWYTMSLYFSFCSYSMRFHKRIFLSNTNLLTQ